MSKKKIFDTIVIGGGAIGTSVSYHLSKLGARNLLVEKNKLTSGTTWHSAGLLWQLRPSDVEIRLIQHTRDLAMGKLEKESGQSCGWVNTGGLFIADHENRLREYKRLQSLGKVFNIDSQILSPAEVGKVHPLLNTSDIIGGLYAPGDGTIDPSGITNSYARAAKKNNCEILENTNVSELILSAGNITGIKTSQGDFHADNVIVCGGSWSELLLPEIPQCSMHHAYIETDFIPESKNLPCVRDHDSSIYFKQQGESIAIGGYEPHPIFWDQVDANFAFSLFDLDLDNFSWNFNRCINRMPIIETKGIKSEICGPESFTPDHKPLMGPVFGKPGLFTCTGFNSAGIMLSGGCGQQMAEWVINGSPTLDMFAYDLNRFHPDLGKDITRIREKSHEAYAKNYSIHYALDQALSGRNFRVSPFHQNLKNCYFVDRHNMESPGYFVNQNATIPPYNYYGYAKNYSVEVTENNNYYKKKLVGDLTFDLPESHHIVGQEVKKCRNDFVVFDQSSFGKIKVIGKEAKQAMDWLCSNDVTQQQNKVTYTCLLNKKGKVMADLTVAMINANEYYITTGGNTVTHDLNWIHRNISQFDCQIENLSDDYGVLSIQGPNSGKFLNRVFDTNIFTKDNFPFSTFKEVKLAGKTCLAFQLTFVGELGWELHIPIESCSAVFEYISAENPTFSGYRAIDSMSAEKGFLHWHHDLRLEDNPFEAGLGFTCKLKTDINFIGRSAVEKSKKKVTKRLVKLLCELPLYGEEPVYLDGKINTFVRRANYGYTIGKWIAYAYIEKDDPFTKKSLFKNSYMIEVDGKKHPVEIFSINKN